MLAVRGMFSSFTVPSQNAVPVTSCAYRTTRHTLVGVDAGFGIGTGAPKRQPAAVQVRFVPVCAAVRAASTRRCVPGAQLALTTNVFESARTAGSGTVLPPPPK